MKRKRRVFSLEFKQGVAQRILNGESVTALHGRLQIKRSVLYRWRDAYRKDGRAGLERSPGRPSRRALQRGGASAGDAAARRIAELERKIGQQAHDLDFLRRAFKRVKESRRTSTTSGGTASTERSEA